MSVQHKDWYTSTDVGVRIENSNGPVVTSDEVAVEITGTQAHKSFKNLTDALEEKVDVGAAVTNVEYDGTAKKIVAYKETTPTDIVTVATIKTDLNLAKGDVGLGNVDNTSDLNKPISSATQTALDAKVAQTAFDGHVNDTDNPHQVTAAQVGLGNVDNTADSEKDVNSAAKDGDGNVITETYETIAQAGASHTTLQGNIDAVSAIVQNLTGLEGTNFGGFSLDAVEATAISNIATIYTNAGYTSGDLYWFLAGTDMSALKAYRYDGSGSPVAISSTVYDFTDFSGLQTQVSSYRGNTNDLDSLNTLASAGTYQYISGSKMGLVSVSYDTAHSSATQIWLSDVIPDEADPTIWNEGPAILMRTYKNSAWSAWQNPIAKNAADIAALGSETIYDVTLHNSGATFASLSSLLSSENLSTLIPASVRCGGMSIRFVQTSVNKYVSYFLTKNEWSTSVSDWQDVSNAINDNTQHISYLNAYISKFIDSQGVNLFNKDSNLNEVNSFWWSSGKQTAQGNQSGITHPILCIGGETYKIPYNGFWSTNYYVARLDDNGNLVETIKVQAIDTSYYLFTAKVTGMYSFNYAMALAAQWMICKESSFPNEYVAYVEPMVKTSKVEGLYDAQIVSEYINGNIFKNLFDKDAGYITGYISDSGQISPTQGKTCLPIPCTPSTIYSVKIFNKTPSADYCRFIDANGNPLKPLDPSTDVELSYEANHNKTLYKIKAPLTAAYMQFTLQFSSQNDDLTNGFMVTQGNYDMPEYFEGLMPLTDFIDYIIGENTKISNIEERENEIDAQLNGQTVQTTITLAYDATGKYVGSTNGQISSYSSLSLAYYPITAGKEYHIHIPQTCNNAGYLLSYASVADGATAMEEVLADYGKGTNPVSSKDLVLNSTYTGYIAVGYNTGATLPTVIKYELSNCIVTEIDNLNIRVAVLEDINKASMLYGKKVFFFGDSLTAASTPGMNGFPKLIAESIGMPYKAFLFDAHDGNTSDVHITYPCFVNYGKDGTTNAKTSSRSDSILERIKRHVDNVNNNDVNYVLVEVGVNDLSSVMGTISQSYTESYDEYTIIGAIEEALRYLTTLGREIHVGYYIPWSTLQKADNYFDDIIEVFKKWGVPYLDLRKSSGFYMRGCAQHRADYSMSADSYSSYNASAVYNLDDKVKYGGNLYKCLQDNVTGIPPTNAEYWLMVSSESYDGTHLNNLGHQTVMGKIKAFIESL